MRGIEVFELTPAKWNKNKAIIGSAETPESLNLLRDNRICLWIILLSGNRCDVGTTCRSSSLTFSITASAIRMTAPIEATHREDELYILQASPRLP